MVENRLEQEPAVTLQSLTKKFGDFTAVDNISFTVNRGEIFGFLGANGAGKSTTIRMLCGILKPTKGRGIVGGVDISKTPELVKPFIGYMSQKFSLYDDLTIEENLNFFAGIYGVKDRKAAVNKAIKSAGLTGKEKKMTGSLPVGWKQQLSLASAVMHSPGILFLDEPTSGVDPIIRRKFWETIRAKAEGGTTVFVTTHYMLEAEYCDRLSIMRAGKVIAIGSPGELKQKNKKDSLEDVFVSLVQGGEEQ
ncbi:MAG: ABC transporter ATP-binding protein [Candidatus Sabulitectum sp.]|nr:ABC transporter ATP-binding protein [Candidatus Sabulitectum sp.]